MSNVNKVILLGRIGQDPDIRHTQDGKQIANLSLATSDKWKDQSGQLQERTEWHRVVVFSGAAGIVEKYVNKGDLLYVEGKLQTRKWTDQQGQDKYTTEVVVDMKGTVQLMPSGDRAAKPAPQAAKSPEPQTAPFDDPVPF